MAVPKSKYIKSKYIKSKYIKSKYIKSKYISKYLMLYQKQLYPYNVKLNYYLLKLLNTLKYKPNINSTRIKIKHAYCLNINIMQVKYVNYNTINQYDDKKNLLRYLFKLNNN